MNEKNEKMDHEREEQTSEIRLDFEIWLWMLRIGADGGYGEEVVDNGGKW